jgi:hypothetical protein
MSGLYMDMSHTGGLGRWSRGGGQTATTQATTVSEAAFGSAYTVPNQRGGLLAFLKPNDPAGITHLAGLTSMAALLFIYWSLPR